MNEVKKERLIELLTDHALLGLDEKELMELNQLKLEFPEWENDISLELVAAAIGLTNLDIDEALPVSLQTKILNDADKFFSGAEKPSNVVPFSGKSRENNKVSANESVGNFVEPAAKQSFWNWTGWAVAAAACVALAVNLWWTATRPPQIVEIIQPGEITKTLTPTPELSVAQKREQLISTATDVVQKNWTSPKDEKEVLGDVVWSNSKQEGYIRLRGLPVTEPSRESYQLWIIDKKREEKNPLSGGVFIMEQADEEVIIPIHAQLDVKEPKLFAITKEKPGGVVVSSPQRIVAIAKI
jgi:anti-sigma-K factor RskA